MHTSMAKAETIEKALEQLLEEKGLGMAKIGVGARLRSEHAP